METTAILEIFGYIGSAMVVISMLMTNIVKLRIINVFGSLISGIYAVICSAFPLALMNFCLIVINLYGLYRLLKAKNSFELVRGNADDALVRHFIDHYRKDILTYFPDFSDEKLLGKAAFTVCCNETPAGILVGKVTGDGFEICLDYTTPAYRDCSVGKYLFSMMPSTDIAISFSGRISDAHKAYMEKMGFTEQQDGRYLLKH